MQFMVLGPLQVAGGDLDEPRVVSASRPRALLAVLLWRANQPVPLDEIAEMVWDGSPPGGARETVRALVMRLRRQLDEQAAARLVTRAPGYAIEVRDGELDAKRFETLTQEAGAAVRAARWAQAARAAAEALELWRGTPLADIPSQMLRDQWVPSLEQLRMQALDWRIEADLHEGRHEQLIPELRDLAARHQLREHFHSQLMLALVRSGRQAEALAAFQQARRALADELGIDPGAELRQLHHRILAGDASLMTPPTAAEAAQPVPAAAPVPRQLPAPVRSFTGRQAELGMLSRWAGRAIEPAGAGGTVTICAIDGMAGVGKTALAIQAAHRLAREFPGGQLFIDMHGYTQGHEPRPAGEALGWFLRGLGVPPQRVPADTEERAALFRERLAGTRIMVVLDNVASEAQVRPLLPGSAGCLMLMTSRRRLKGLDDAQVLALDVLPQADALALFRAVAGPGRVPADDPVLPEIAGLCGRLPLALRVAAALLRHRPAWPLEHLAGLLRAQEGRIRVLSDGERDVGAVFDLSCQSLPAACRRLFRLLGLIPGPDLDACAAAALAGTAPASAARLLETLTDHNLVIQHAPGRYCLHDLIRLHARALAARDPAPGRGAALDRLLEYYQHTAGRAHALITPFPHPAPAGPEPAHPPVLQDPDAAWRWLRAERPNLLAAIQHASGHAQPRRAIALTADLAPVLHADGPGSQAIALHTAAASAAGSLADERGLAWALTELAHARRATFSGDRGAAGDLERALEIYQSLGERPGQGYVLLRLAEVRATDGDCPSAAGDLEHALEIYQSLGEQRGQAQALAQLGDVRRMTGDFPAAAGDLERALQIYQSLGERSGQGYVLLRLAEVRRLTGDYPGAAGDLERALEIYQSLGDRRGQAHIMTWLVMVRLPLTGACPGMTRDLEHAFEVYGDIGDLNGQAQVLTVLGRVRLSAGDLQDATRHLEAALGMFRQLGYRGNEPWVLNNYAAVIAAAGDHAHARDLYRDALRLARAINQPDEEALALEGTGECHLHAGDAQTGIAHLEQALKVFQRVGMKLDAGRVRTRLAQLRGIPHDEIPLPAPAAAERASRTPNS